MEGVEMTSLNVPVARSL